MAELRSAYCRHGLLGAICRLCALEATPELRYTFGPPPAEMACAADEWSVSCAACRRQQRRGTALATAARVLAALALGALAGWMARGAS